MTKLEAERFLDKQIKLFYLTVRCSEFDEDVCTCTGKYEKEIMMYKGIEKLASALDVRDDFKARVRSDKKTVELYFTYKGFKVFQLMDIKK